MHRVLGGPLFVLFCFVLLFRFVSRFAPPRFDAPPRFLFVYLLAQPLPLPQASIAISEETPALEIVAQAQRDLAQAQRIFEALRGESVLGYWVGVRRCSRAFLVPQRVPRGVTPRS